MSPTSVTAKTIAERVKDLTSRLDRCLSEGAKVFTGPSIHFHHLTIQRLAELGSVESAVSDDQFQNYLYATVACWGMHRMGPKGKGAKMVEFDVFTKSLVQNTRQDPGSESQAYRASH